MKLNKILMALAAMAMVGCSSEDVNDFSANQAIDEAGLIQLDDNFVIAGVGEEGDVTRTHWDMNAAGALVNKFLPIWATAPAVGNTIADHAALEAQAVGLCWLGNGAVGTDVYTNYEFYHFGWLKNGATDPEFECNNLTNGALYDEITVAAGDAAGAEANTANFTGFTGAKTFAIGALNYNTGIYKTENKAIFGGQYIVYYPYNEDFKNAGTIPAKAETQFNPVSESYDAPAVGHATFRYSAPVTIEGGSKAAGFGLYNLSTLVQLRVATPTSVDLSAKNIDKIVLYSAKKQLLAQANLAADQIAAGSKGEALYTETEGTKTITAAFGAPVSLKKTNAGPTSAYITVLPTTVADLKVLVHNSTDQTWATVDMPNTVFEAGKAKRLDITVDATSFKSEYIAVDEATLIAARNEARAAGGSKTVTVIGDIVLDGTHADAPGTYDFYTNANDKKITYKGDAIIVPEDITFQVGTKIQSDLRVLGKSCCTGALGARLEIHNNAVLNNVTVEETEANVVDDLTYNNYNPLVTYVGGGTAEIAAGKTFDVKAGRVEVYGAVKHKGDLNLAAKVYLTVWGSGDLNFMGGSVVNNGTIEVKKDGQYDMTDKNGNATATDGQRMTNNGKFIHNVDAQVGTAVQSMHQNGEYRCRVNKQIKLDDALLQWTACSVIEMVNTVAENYNLGTGASIHLLDPSFEDYKHNGKYIDYEVNAGALTTFTNPANGAGNGDSKVIEVGKLSVLAGGLDVDYVTGTGKRTLKVWGDMDVKATTTFVDSKLIDLKENLNVSGAGVTLFYKGAKKNEDGLKVAKNITVTGGTFDAGSLAADVNALNIECANFKLKSGAKAYFGNRTEGDAKNMTVTGEISNPSGCTFDIIQANQDGNGSVYAWITCTKLTVGGSFPNARPKVVAAAE